MQPLADVPVGREQSLRDLNIFLGRGSPLFLRKISGTLCVARGRLGQHKLIFR